MNANTAFFTLTISKQDGSLERLLGRVRRRGFKVESMVVTALPVDSKYRIELTLEGVRCFEKLAKHLSTLQEIVSIRLRTTSLPLDFASINTIPQPAFATIR